MTASESISFPPSSLGISAVSIIDGPNQSFSLFPQSSSFRSSNAFPSYCCDEVVPVRQLSNDFPDLKKGLAPLDNVIMTIPFSPIQSFSPMVPAPSLPPGAGGPKPHYNLRPLAIRKGKGPVVGGLELDVGLIGPRKLRGRK